MDVGDVLSGSSKYAVRDVMLVSFLADVNSRSRSLLAIAIPSVVCLSVCRLSVTLVHPTQAVELFGNFFSPYDSPGTLLSGGKNR